MTDVTSIRCLLGANSGRMWINGNNDNVGVEIQTFAHQEQQQEDESLGIGAECHGNSEYIGQPQNPADPNVVPEE